MTRVRDALMVFLGCLLATFFFALVALNGFDAHRDIVVAMFFMAACLVWREFAIGDRYLFSDFNRSTRKWRRKILFVFGENAGDQDVEAEEVSDLADLFGSHLYGKSLAFFGALFAGYLYLHNRHDLGLPDGLVFFVIAALMLAVASHANHLLLALFTSLPMVLLGIWRSPLHLPGFVAFVIAFVFALMSFRRLETAASVAAAASAVNTKTGKAPVRVEPRQKIRPLVVSSLQASALVLALLFLFDRFLPHASPLAPPPPLSARVPYSNEAIGKLASALNPRGGGGYGGRGSNSNSTGRGGMGAAGREGDSGGVSSSGGSQGAGGSSGGSGKGTSGSDGASGVGGSGDSGQTSAGSSPESGAKGSADGASRASTDHGAGGSGRAKEPGNSKNSEASPRSESNSSPQSEEKSSPGESREESADRGASKTEDSAESASGIDKSGSRETSGGSGSKSSAQSKSKDSGAGNAAAANPSQSAGEKTSGESAQAESVSRNADEEAISKSEPPQKPPPEKTPEKTPENTPEKTRQLEKKLTKWFDQLGTVAEFAAGAAALFLLFRFLSRVTKKVNVTEVKQIHLSPEDRQSLRRTLQALRERKLSPSEEILQTYHALLDIFEAVHFARAPEVPVSVFADTIRTTLPYLGPHLQEATSCFEATLYGEQDVPAPRVQNFRGSVQKIVRYFNLQ